MPIKKKEQEQKKKKRKKEEKNKKKKQQSNNSKVFVTQKFSLHEFLSNYVSSSRCDSNQLKNIVFTLCFYPK